MTTKNKNHLGIMQGRLSPAINDRIQAFPLKTWQAEFKRAATLGLTGIEWIFDQETESVNPLMTAAGVKRILGLSAQCGVCVKSLVANYFMTARLFGDDQERVKRVVKKLILLITQCAQCRIKLIVLPFLETSALTTNRAFSQVTENLRAPAAHAADLGIRLCLETSLEPPIFSRFLTKLSPLNISANYDMGNSAAAGYDPCREIRLLGKRIIGVHVKDRLFNGGTVPLGKGAVDFAAVFATPPAIGYGGDYIFEAARQDLSTCHPPKEPLVTAREYMAFIAQYMKKE